MGMESELLCIGKFSKEISNCLDYPDYYYDNVKKDAPVTSHLFQCVTADGSYNLALAFNIDPWDFNTHYMKFYKINNDIIANLYKLLNDNYICPSWGEEDIDKLKKLVDYKFYFFFLPHG